MIIIFLKEVDTLKVNELGDTNFSLIISVWHIQILYSQCDTTIYK